MHRSVKIQVLLSLVFVFAILLLTSQAVAKPVDKAKSGKAVKTFLKIEQLREEKKEEKLAKKGKKILKSIQKHKLENTTPIYGENGELFAWVTELEPEGYVVTSADDRINPIIAYSFKGKFPFKDSKQNVLLHMVQWDMEIRQNTINRQPKQLAFRSTKNNKKWADYSSDGITAMESMTLAEASSTQTQWPDPSYGYDGWIKTNWYQTGTFNDFCPKKTVGGFVSSVGCVATAMAQIINYWKYPSSVYFDDADTYTSKGNIGDIQIDDDSTTRDFPSFSELNTAMSTLNYNNDTDEDAYLCFAAGIKTKMDYGNGSGTSVLKAASALLNGFNYGSAKKDSNILLWTRKKNKVIEDIKKGWPCQIGISYYLFWNPHSVIIDGYDSITGNFHINTGWSDIDSDTWYDLPNIDTTLHGQDDKFTLIQTLIYDISPYQGWNQSGADEKNSFSTIYVAPTTDPPLSKWQGTCPSSHSFSGLVVGTGNKIYAACSANASTGHPYVYVINQYGELLKTIEINEDVKIEFICQSLKGDVFISTENGFVYRIDISTDTATKIFTEPNGDDIYTLKVDGDGYLYACTFYNLYRLDKYGTQQWKFPAPANTMFIDGGKDIAVDTDRDKVYAVYYNTNTKVPYLIQLNRTSGSTIATRTFSSIPLPKIRMPIVGSDGTIYVGIHVTHYALNYTNINDTPKWTKNLNLPYRAISQDGQTLYATYWEEIGGTWYNKLAAFNSSDGSEKWAIPFLLDTETESVWQPYVAGNNVICFTVERDGSPKTYTVYAYRDNGTGYDYLWQYDAGTSGGDFAFGPGATLYFWGLTGLADTIYAVSEGDVGDPEGGGMAYTDNVRPNIPATPNPIDGANDVNSTVILSWSCSDPENHSIKYSIFVGESGYDMVPIATDITNTSYQLTGLGSLTSYRWMVVASDGQATSEGPTWRFSTGVSADINKDDKVNLQDYAALAKNWKVTDCNDLNDWCEKADIDKSGVVDFNDLFVMAEQWLTVPATFVAPYNSSSPTIDGVLSGGEWGNSYTVTMDRVDGGGQHDINLYFQNDGTYLFIGVNSQWGSGWDVVWDWYIDGDYSRTINGKLSQPYTDINICQQSPGGWSGYRAYRTLTDTGGVRVGYDSGADSASSGSTNVSYEFRIPLADLDVIIGDSIGLIITHGYDGIAEHLYQLSLAGSLTTPENWATLKLDH